jgi:hypothetical protein
MAALRGAVGEVNSASEMGKWLSWADAYANRSDPLNRLHNRTTEPITLYYFGYDRDHVAQQGFREPELTGYGNEKTKPGIELTERPPRLTAYERAFKIALPEDVVLPYEWPQESDDYWRVFRVPATLLNIVLGLAGSSATQSSGLESEEAEDEDL